MSPMTAPSKWALGEPMNDWCARNGLDVAHIIDQPDAIVTSEVDGQLVADVLHVATSELTGVAYDDVVQAYVDGFGMHYFFVRRLPVDSEPPLNPEWARHFGPDAPPHPMA